MLVWPFEEGGVWIRLLRWRLQPHWRYIFVKTDESTARTAIPTEIHPAFGSFSPFPFENVYQAANCGSVEIGMCRSLPEPCRPWPAAKTVPRA
jgi:hypothetical protein